MEQKKSATQGQFHEFISKVLTLTDYENILSSEIQSFIKDPSYGVSALTNFLNCFNQLNFKNLWVVKSRPGCTESSPTSLQIGDSLVFYYKEGTVAVHREDSAKRVLFCTGGLGNYDDKTLTSLSSLEEILGQCYLLAMSMYCKAEWIRRESLDVGLIFVKFV